MITPSIQNLEVITPSKAAIGVLETAKWFDAGHQAASVSPIDEFLDNLYDINKIYLKANANSEYSPMLGSLAFMGMVSAAESYFRSLLRRLVLIDDRCKYLAARRTVTYSAAVHHQEELLPEALLEGLSFASTKTVASELKTLCGIEGMTKDGGVPVRLQPLFASFEDICQIRHCGIHRFGKLGSNQALSLGMDKHHQLMEKPLTLTVPQLEEVAQALEALVRGVNSHCFFDVIKRTYTQGPDGEGQEKWYHWNWEEDLALDRPRFQDYYSIFASQKTPNHSIGLDALYAEFLDFIVEYRAALIAKHGSQRKAKQIRLPQPIGTNSTPKHISAQATARQIVSLPASPATSSTTKLSSQNNFRNILSKLKKYFFNK